VTITSQVQRINYYRSASVVEALKNKLDEAEASVSEDSEECCHGHCYHWLLKDMF